MNRHQEHLYELAAAEVMGVIFRALSRDPNVAENWRFLKDVAEPLVRRKLLDLVNSLLTPPDPPKGPTNANNGRTSPAPVSKPTKV